MSGAPPKPDNSELAKQTTQHATCVAAHGKGVLLTGSSGSGKSSLAMSMMGLGATLIADDRVNLSVVHGRVMASAPATIAGLIEVRGIGILKANTNRDSPIELVIDLDHIELDRLPPFRHITVMGHSVPLLYKVETLHFPAAVMQYLAYGRQDE